MFVLLILLPIILLFAYFYLKEDAEDLTDELPEEGFPEEEIPEEGPSPSRCGRGATRCVNIYPEDESYMATDKYGNEVEIYTLKDGVEVNTFDHNYTEEDYLVDHQSFLGISNELEQFSEMDQIGESTWQNYD